MQGIEVYDVSPRDGDQAAGVNLSVQDKLWFARNADALEFHYVEIGFPSSNKIDLEVAKILSADPLRITKAVAFGMTCRKHKSADEDPALQLLQSIGLDHITLVGKSSFQHVESAIQTTGQENIRMIRDSIAFLVASEKTVIFDAEHFFDGWRIDRKYSMEVLDAAVEGGSNCLVLCDTNGGSSPEFVEEVVRVVCAEFSDQTVGIHPHNDRGLATANARSAVNAGVRHVQGTINGFGERTGNLCLLEAVANLEIDGQSVLPKESVRRFTSVSEQVSKVSGLPVRSGRPLFGRNAFAHKGGMHASAVEKFSQLYEFIDPERFGNSRRIVGSKQSGLSNIRQIINATPLLSPDTLDKLVTNNDFLKLSLEYIKQKESSGFEFDNAEGSLALQILCNSNLVTRLVEPVSSPFIIDQLGENTLAFVKVRIASQQSISLEAAEGAGPVEAIARALVKAVRPVFPSIDDVRLIDYESTKSQESDEGAHSIVNVFSKFTDGSNIWRTAGSSRDSIEASWQSILDAVEFKLAMDNIQTS